MFEAYNFRELAFSKISRKQFSQITENFAELNFQGSMPISEKRENDVPQQFGADTVYI